MSILLSPVAPAVGMDDGNVSILQPLIVEFHSPNRWPITSELRVQAEIHPLREHLHFPEEPGEFLEELKIRRRNHKLENRYHYDHWSIPGMSTAYPLPAWIRWRKMPSQGTAGIDSGVQSMDVTDTDVLLLPASADGPGLRVWEESVAGRIDPIRRHSYAQLKHHRTLSLTEVAAAAEGSLESRANESFSEVARTIPDGPWTFSYRVGVPEQPSPEFWISGVGSMWLGRSFFRVPTTCPWWDSAGWPDTSQKRMLETMPPLQDVINLIVPGCTTYYHFFLEALPRLIGLPESVWRDSQHQILLPELHYPSQEVLLDWLGIPQERIVFLSFTDLRRVEGEVINPPQCECFGCNPNLVKNLRRYFFTRTWMAEAFPDRDTPFPMEVVEDDSGQVSGNPSESPRPSEGRLRVNTVFWMQRSGIRRVVLNEAELLEALRGLIPEARIVVHPAEEEDYEVIASRIQESDLIIGPHGAGWTHLIFARPGFRSVEFLAEELPRDMYVLLAKAMGGRKHVQLIARGGSGSPLRVDVQKFRETVLDALRLD